MKNLTHTPKLIKVFAASGLLFAVAACSGGERDESKLKVSVLRETAHGLMEAGNNDGAILVYDQIIGLVPEDALAYNGKAVALDNLGEHEAAQQIYAQALELAPDYTPIKNNLAMSYILSKQADAAIDLLQPIVDAGDDNKVVRHNLAMAYGVAGEKKKALELNMVDMSKKQALANQSVYDQMAGRGKQKTVADASKNDGKNKVAKGSAPAKAMKTAQKSSDSGSKTKVSSSEAMKKIWAKMLEVAMRANRS